MPRRARIRLSLEIYCLDIFDVFIGRVKIYSFYLFGLRIEILRLKYGKREFSRDVQTNVKRYTRAR